MLVSGADLEEALHYGLATARRDSTLPARVQARFGRDVFRTRIERIFSSVVANSPAPHGMAAA
jgi:hypothetical protein